MRSATSRSSYGSLTAAAVAVAIALVPGRLRAVVLNGATNGVAPSCGLPTGAHTLSASDVPLRMNFRRHQGFILIEGQVDGQTGVFILDTGSPFPFFLNREFVNLGPGEVAAHGNAGSGQSVEVRLHREAHALRLAGGVTVAQPEVRSGNLGFVAKGLGIPLLGFVGSGFLRDYRFTLDGRLGEVRLCPAAADLAQAGESKPLAVIRLQPAEEVPSLLVEVGDRRMPAILDTGAADSVSLTASTRAALSASGLLTSEGQGAARTLGLHALRHNGLRFDLVGAKDGGQSSDRMILGHGFLLRYRSVWDLRAGTVELLTP